MRIRDWSSDVCSSDLIDHTARSISFAAASGSARLAWHQKSKCSGSLRQNTDNSSLQTRAYSFAKSPAQYMKQWDGVDMTSLSTPRSAISLRRLSWVIRARRLACASSSEDALAGCLVPSAKCPTVSPWRSEEHTSELQSLMRISYAVFCLK